MMHFEMLRREITSAAEMLGKVTLSDLSPLTNHLWQSTLFAAVAWWLTQVLKKNRAAVRYWLWLAASVKFLIPFSWLVSLGGQFEWRQAPAVAVAMAMAPPQWSNVVENIGHPFAASAPAMEAAAAPASAPIPYAAILFVVWLCGFAIGMVLWFRWWRQIRTAQHGATPLKLGLSIPVMCSPSRVEPGVVGIRKPVLLLPEGITDRLSPAQLQAVIAHEMCHVERRDNLTAAMHMLVEALFWFHPLVWWIRARLIEEREQACDEAVLQAGSDAEAYAESILTVCKLYIESPLPCVSGIGGADLKKRIIRIMTQGMAEKLTSRGKVLIGAAAAAAIAIPLAVGLMGSSHVHAQETAANDTTPASFETASIKVDKAPSAKLRSQIFFPNRFVTTSTAQWLIEYAYSSRRETCDLALALCNVQELGDSIIDDQIVGGPEWMRSEMFDLDATVAQALAEKEEEWPDQVGPMLKSLLANRFKLKIRHERMDRPVYALVVAKGGLKLSPDNSQSDGGIRALGQGKFQLTSSTMSNLTRLLSGRPSLGQRTVLDKTGLLDRYSFNVQLAEESDGLPEVSEPAVSKALEEQLGLKLEQTSMPMDTIIVEHIEKPGEN
jgi:bla regulator protein BlaR1